MNTRFCPNGHPVPAGLAFCPICGIQVVGAPPPPTTADRSGLSGRAIAAIAVVAFLVAGGAVSAVLALGGSNHHAPSAAPPTSSTSTSSTTASSSTSSSTAVAAVPVLGRSWAPFQKGYGMAKPTTIDNGGDPTGIVDHITWQTWGSAKATGTGTGNYDPPNQPVSNSVQDPATVVAFNLGNCQGTLMYQAVEWYFAGQGQSFDPTTFWNICTGQYVQPPVVSVAPALTVESGIVTALSTYFGSINSGQYQAAYAVLSPAEQATVSEAQFAANDSTTKDQGMTIVGAGPANSGSQQVTIVFTSNQAANEGPNGNTCDHWDIDYNMVLSGGSWLINSTSSPSSSPFTSC